MLTQPVLRADLLREPARCWGRVDYRLDPDADGAIQARLCVHLQPDRYDTDSLIKVLEQLAGFYAGHRVVLVWDGLSSHWSHKMRAHLDAQRAWLTVERLPADAPERKVGRVAVVQPQGW